MSDDENIAALLAEDDDAEFGEVSDDQLRRISKLAAAKMEIEKDIDKAKEHLAQLNGKLKEIEEIELPNAMEDAGMKKFTLLDGSEVTIADMVSISITKEGKDSGATFEWLEENGHGSIVRHVVQSAFKRGEDEAAKALVALLEENGIPFDDKQDVHWKTLESWYKQELENGRDVPENLFNAYEFKKAKIKPAG